ncbi:MAG: hypothetical protein Q9200_007383 [Gallowayella weberi]
MALGADGYVATSEEDGWEDKYAASLDLIVCTVSDPRMPLAGYLGMLRPKGKFCQVGIPEEPFPQLDVMSLVLNGTSICFSDSASPGNIREMLQLAADKGIKAWTQVRPMAKVNETLKDMEAGKARFSLHSAPFTVKLCVPLPNTPIIAQPFDSDIHRRHNYPTRRLFDYSPPESGSAIPSHSQRQQRDPKQHPPFIVPSLSHG